MLAIFSYTQHAILDIINDIQANMNQHLLSCGVFIDLKKAFDTVDQEILLKEARNSFHFPQTSFTNSFPVTVWFIVSV